MSSTDNIEREIRSSIRRLRDAIKDNVKTLDNYVQLIFLLLMFLVEYRYSQKEHDGALSRLKCYFEEAKRKYGNDSEFLFFLGYLIPIAECYFDIDDVSDAYQMLERAMLASPENILYKWAYYSSLNPDSKKVHILEKMLVTQPNLGLNWLKSKGMLGVYIIGMIEKSSLGELP